MTFSHVKFKKASYYYLMSNLFSNPPYYQRSLQTVGISKSGPKQSLLTAFDCSISQTLSDRADSSCL